MRSVRQRHSFLDSPDPALVIARLIELTDTDQLTWDRCGIGWSARLDDVPILLSHPNLLPQVHVADTEGEWHAVATIRRVQALTRRVRAQARRLTIARRASVRAAALGLAGIDPELDNDRVVEALVARTRSGDLTWSRGDVQIGEYYWFGFRLDGQDSPGSPSLAVAKMSGFWVLVGSTGRGWEQLKVGRVRELALLARAMTPRKPRRKEIKAAAPPGDLHVNIERILAP